MSLHLTMWGHAKLRATWLLVALFFKSRSI